MDVYIIFRMCCFFKNDFMCGSAVIFDANVEKHCLDYKSAKLNEWNVELCQLTHNVYTASVFYNAFFIEKQFLFFFERKKYNIADQRIFDGVYSGNRQVRFRRFFCFFNNNICIYWNVERSGLCP